MRKLLRIIWCMIHLNHKADLIYEDEYSRTYKCRRCGKLLEYTSVIWVRVR